ncbi:MAG: TetR/AcrR family transcriptional regulator, partial [Clostridia bacterium]|nr:TetR/AcrR family transcriptional regulator [Clostridia bacterium]
MKQSGQNVSPMSNEGRNAYVVEHIRAALLALLAEKQIDDISISELCDKAQVGRASFYRNYENKEDILKAYLRQILDEWVSEYAKSEGIPLNEQIRTIFTHFERHRDFYELLNDRGLIYLLRDVV